MTVEYADTLRNSRADVITAARDAAVTAGLIRIYDGVRPAKGGTVTTLLAELTFSDPSAPAAVGGVLTANAITGDASAPNSGTATWFREVDGDGNFILDGDVTTVAVGTGDMLLNDVNIVSGQPVNISSNISTEGNA